MCGQRLGGRGELYTVQMGFNRSGVIPDTDYLLPLLFLWTWEREADAVGVKVSTLLKVHVGVNVIQLSAILQGCFFLTTCATI